MIQMMNANFGCQGHVICLVQYLRGCCGIINVNIIADCRIHVIIFCSCSCIGSACLAG